MPRYNDKFELSVEDMELIEEALRRSKRELTNGSLSAKISDMKSGEEAEQSVRQIHDLLGRLHNQKVFYRPQSGAYVGG
jgi:hypothetical protein